MLDPNCLDEDYFIENVHFSSDILMDINVRLPNIELDNEEIIVPIDLNQVMLETYDFQQDFETTLFDGLDALNDSIRQNPYNLETSLDLETSVFVEPESWSKTAQNHNITVPTRLESIEPHSLASIFDDIMGQMNIHSHPNRTQRPRYASEGPRYLKGSREHPIEISLPDLSSIASNDSQKIGLLVNIVTTLHNPEHERYIHVNKIRCGIIGNETYDQGTFIPLTHAEIKNRLIKIKKLGIINKKLHEYPAELVLFDSTFEAALLRPNEVEEIDASHQITRAKKLCDDYQLNECQIVFQLVLIDGDVLVISKFSCFTNKIVELTVGAVNKTVHVSSNSNGRCLSHKKSTKKAR